MSTEHSGLMIDIRTAMAEVVLQHHDPHFSRRGRDDVIDCLDKELTRLRSFIEVVDTEGLSDAKDMGCELTEHTDACKLLHAVTTKEQS